MKKILLILCCTLTVSACGVTYKAKKLSGIYVFVCIDSTTKKIAYDRDDYLILKKNGDFLKLQIGDKQGFRGAWSFTAKNKILLKCDPKPPKVDLATMLSPGYTTPPEDWDIEIINKNRLRINDSDALIYVRFGTSQ